MRPEVLNVGDRESERFGAYEEALRHAGHGDCAKTTALPIEEEYVHRYYHAALCTRSPPPVQMKEDQRLNCLVPT